MSCESHSVVVVIILYFPSSFTCLAYLDSHRSGKINEKDSQREGGGMDFIECFRVVVIYGFLSS